MPDSPAETIAVTGHGPSETVVGMLRAVACVAGAWGVVYLDHEAWKYALGVMALVGSPAPLRAVIAPVLAHALRRAAKGIE